MKTLKRVFFAIAVFAFTIALTACYKKQNPNVKPEETSTFQPVEAGFTDLNIVDNKGNPKKGINPFAKNGKVTFGSDTFTLSKTYKKAYAVELSGEMFNYLKNDKNWNSQVYANMVDGLITSDRFGSTVGELAIGVKKEENAKKWTFQLRKNVPWVVNKTGELYKHDGKIQYVKAQDFVTSIEYGLNKKNGAPFIETLSIIEGAKKYNKATDGGSDLELFKTVGVKALRDDLLEFTLVDETPYFDTVLTYTPFLPVNEHFLKEVGSEFGRDENKILVNGAFRLVKNIHETEKEFVKNQHYYDKGHVYFDQMIWKYVPHNADASFVRERYEKCDIDVFGLSSLDHEGYKKYVGRGSLQNPENKEATGVKVVDSSTFYGIFNFNRKTFEYTDSTQVKNDIQKSSTQIAVRNKNFRLAFAYGMKFEQFLKTRSNDPHEKIYRRYTCGELGITKEGKDYVDYFDEVFNEKQSTTGVKLSGLDNGSEPVYSREKAKANIQIALNEIKAAGATLPIIIDVLGDRDVTEATYSKIMYDDFAALAKEANGGIDAIEFHINTPQSDAQHSAWLFETHNYDFTIGGGWGPDYADPKTFLNTITIGGDIFESFGLTQNDVNEQFVKDIFGEYDKMAREAFAETKDLDKRFKLMAKAEYKALYEDALIIPYYARNGWSVIVGKTLPYTANRAQYGIVGDKLKNVMVSETQLTREQRNKLRKLFYEGKGKKIDEGTITFNGIEGWIAPPSITGEKGQVVLLPTPVQEKYDISGNLIPADKRQLFDGWYLDADLKTQVPKVNGKYVLPDKDTTYYLKSKAYVLPQPELVNSANSSIITQVGTLNEILIRHNDNADKLVAIIEQKQPKKDNPNVGEFVTAANQGVVAAVIEGDRLFISATEQGVFKVIVRAHNWREGEKQIEVEVKVPQNDFATKVDKFIYVDPVSGTPTEVAIVDDKVAIEIKHDSSISGENKIYNVAFTTVDGKKFDRVEVTRNPVEGSACVNYPFGPDGSGRLLGKREGVTTYTFKFINVTVDETTGKVAAKTAQTVTVTVTVKK